MTNTIKLDFNSSCGPMKPLHGVNNSRIDYRGEALPEFVEAGIPFCRLHDTGGAFGGSHFVDIPNVFPNFDADPEDPASYDFAFTDVYFKSLTASGTKIFYRLGITIENNFRIKAYHIAPPKDYAKWAHVCEMVVRHYNEGWANGMQLGIEYWEVWNEPENPPMWSGTREDYFELYRVTANHLKQCFPNIKVGGYAGCGFYSLNRTTSQNDFYIGFLTWFNDFLKFVTSPETSAPLDFYSWHLYTDDPHEIIIHAEYVQRRLDAFGLTETENIFDEWNLMYHPTRNGENIHELQRTMEGAAFTAASFALMQYSPIDKAMYYDALPTRTYGSFYLFPQMKVSQAGSTFAQFNKLYKLGTAVNVSVAGDKNVYAVAAKGDAGRAALIVNYTTEPQEIVIDANGCGNISAIKLLDNTPGFVDAPVPCGNTITLNTYAVALVEFY